MEPKIYRGRPSEVTAIQPSKLNEGLFKTNPSDLMKAVFGLQGLAEQTQRLDPDTYGAGQILNALAANKDNQPVVVQRFYHEILPNEQIETRHHPISPNRRVQVPYTTEFQANIPIPELILPLPTYVGLIAALRTSSPAYLPDWFQGMNLSETKLGIYRLAFEKLPKFIEIQALDQNLLLEEPRFRPLRPIPGIPIHKGAIEKATTILRPLPDFNPSLLNMIYVAIRNPLIQVTMPSTDKQSRIARTKKGSTDYIYPLITRLSIGTNPEGSTSVQFID